MNDTPYLEPTGDFAPADPAAPATPYVETDARDVPYAHPPAPYSHPAAPPPPMPMPAPVPAREREARRRGGFGTWVAAALAGGLIGAAALGAALFGFGLIGRVPAPTPAPARNAATVGTLTIGAQPIEAVAAKVLPSVVNIAVSSGSGFNSSTGVASGVIIRSDGYILTNNHVVEGASRIVVRLGTSDLTARVVGTDPSSDLAVIKIDKTGLPAAVVGSSAGLQVGEGVIAVGSPFGLDKTVTSGIVSALHRTNLTQGQAGVTAYTNLIQTDAPINPGNSGGALADFSGAVVGINTLILSPGTSGASAQSAGIGFAIPIDFAMTIADALIAGKPITHPFLGVSTATLDEDIAQSYSLPVSSGALIQQLRPDSPAMAAGLQVGDIIVRINDTVIATSEDVFVAIRGSAIGQRIEIEVVRGASHTTVTATLASDTGA